MAALYGISDRDITYVDASQPFNPYVRWHEKTAKATLTEQIYESDARAGRDYVTQMILGKSTDFMDSKEQ